MGRKAKITGLKDLGELLSKFKDITDVLLKLVKNHTDQRDL